jgi:hypothetical protein
LLQVGRQPCPLAPQFLRALGLVPDLGQFQFAADLFETFLLRVVVKETPEASWRARRGP